MPTIRPSSDLRNKYNEISSFCHDNSEPVYITKNEKRGFSCFFYCSGRVLPSHISPPKRVATMVQGNINE